MSKKSNDADALKQLLKLSNTPEYKKLMLKREIADLRQQLSMKKDRLAELG